MTKTKGEGMKKEYHLEWTDKTGKHHFKTLSKYSVVKYIMHLLDEGCKHITVDLSK